jgi:nitroreductase
MDTQEAIRSKRAIRKFTEQKLTKETVLEIINAGRHAQSSKNTQPWHFIAIQDKSTLSELSKLGHFAGHLAGATLGVAIVTPHPDTRFSVMFDAGQAAAYMQLAAWNMGIGSCLATIYEPEQARRLLDFPDDLHVRIAISFGYPLDIEKQNIPIKKGGRRSLDEVVHWERW